MALRAKRVTSPVQDAPEVTALEYRPLAASAAKEDAAPAVVADNVPDKPSFRTVLREAKAKIDESSATAEGFTYNALDVLSYLREDTPELVRHALVTHVQDSTDIKAQAAYRRVRKGSKEKAALSGDDARKYMLDIFSVLPSNRTRVAKADRLIAEAAKMSPEEKKKLLEMLGGVA